MIRALYNLGKIYEKQHESKSELLDIIENPNESGNYKNVIKLNFNYHNDKITYNGYVIEDFSNEKIIHYLYKKIGGNAGDYTPTSKVTSFTKTVKNLIKPLSKITSDEFQSLYKYLDINENREKIINDLSKYNPKDGYIITTIINNKWLNEYDAVINSITERNNSKYYDKYNKISKNTNSICYVCMKKKGEVYGFVNTYNFFTVDKKGFVAGGFLQENAWKNYPVCPQCALLLEKGKKFIEDGFIDRFAGFTYMVIPKFISEIKDNKTLEYCEELLMNFKNKNKISVSKIRDKQLLSNEKISLDAMSEMENNLSFNIMFYKEDKAVFSILLNIEDVLPSRLRTIFNAKKEIENANIYQNLKGKIENTIQTYYNLLFNFGIIRDFFPNKMIEGNWDKNFLEIVNSIFINKKIDYNFIINNFLRIITPKINNGGSVYIDCRKSILILEFLVKMDLILNKETGGTKEMITITEKNEIFLKFFEEHEKVFDTDIKRAIFLEGLFVRKLLNQPEQQQSKQFYARLNSLKMNEKIVKRIFVEVVNKLHEYKKSHYYSVIEKLISEYFSSSDFSTITNDEMSYYFVLGMNLSDKFKNNEETEDQQEGVE